MSDPNINKPVTPAPPAAAAPQTKGESMLQKIGGGLSWWIGSLTGKPQTRKPAAVTPKPQAAPAPQASSPAGVQVPASETAKSEVSSAAASEDSVAADLQQLKKLVGKFSSNIQKSATPVVSKGVSSSSKAASSFLGKNRKFLSLVLKAFFIIVLLMVLVFVAMKFLKNNPQVTPPGNKQESPTVTPTPIVYQPVKPSVYAEDEEILKLEKDIDVLVREISGTNIKETTLNPPQFDFAVTF